MVHNGLTHTLTRSYSDSGYLGRDIGFSLDSDYGVGYEFDSYGRLNAVTGSVGVASALRADYSYLANSDLVTQMSNSYGQVWTRSYESDRNLITSIENTFGTNVISRYAYGNDPLARRTNRIDTGSAISAGATNVFGYNDRSELTSALMTTNGYAYSYDPIGNRLISVNPCPSVVTNSYTCNELNQYTEITNGSGQNLSYDPDGSLTNDGYWCYTWNCENRLIQVEPITPTNDARKVKFVYDYMGRRTSKSVSQWISNQWDEISESTFIYDSWNLISETTVNPEPGTTNVSSYVFGLDLSGTLQGAGGIGGLLSWTRSSDTNTFLYCFDANGNVGQVLDASDGSIAAAYEYSAYGETITGTGSESENNIFRFSTKPFDLETGFGYWGMRYYHPGEGRWLSTDPLGRHGGMNCYCFTLNCPPTHYDILGLKPSWNRGVSICATIANAWQRRQKLTGWGLLGQWWNYYTKHLRHCRVDWHCRGTCSKGVCSPAYVQVRKGRCDITMCGNNIKKPTISLLLGYAVHELTHCFQGNVSNRGTADCASCICNELQSYHRQNPSWSNQVLLLGASYSCTGMGKGHFCSDYAEFWDIIRSQPSRKAYIDHCKKGGH